MQYDVIILGATFAAAGLLQEYGQRALVLERRPQAGYEFLNALRYGDGYEQPLVSEAAAALRQQFAEKGAFGPGERLCLFDCASPFYRTLAGQNVLLQTEILSVARTEDGFLVKTHGVAGHRSYTAAKVIDTRTPADAVAARHLNVMVDNRAGEPLPTDCEIKPWGYDEDLLLRCPVAPDADWLQARRAVAERIAALPGSCRVVLVADVFDDTLQGSFPDEREGVVRLPSVAFRNPLLAFDAGVCYAKGGAR